MTLPQNAGLPGPKEFVLGVATAAYQIEGGVTEDGRGASVWDVFAAQPGKVRDARDGSVACDSYHRVEEDLDLVAGLGVDFYRFSISWPRILPEGRGRIEPRGLDYYERLVDGLLERGLLPSCTLYHWDLPQRLEEEGGWLERRTAEAFADYAEIVHARLGDRVSMWATHNEPWCAAYLGYAAGVHAPGRSEGPAAHRAAHHLLLSHGLASERLRAGGADAVGIVLNLAPIWAEGEDASNVAAGVDALRNRVWLDPLADGRYGEDVLRVAPELADDALVQEGDLDLVRGSLDWVGVNYYTPVRPATPQPDAPAHPEGGAYPGVEPFDLVVRDPRTDIGWEIDPRGLTEVLVDTHARLGVPVVVAENGAAMADDVVLDGVVRDEDRIDYLRSHLAAVSAAREAGADVRGYFVWTLLDNFEWAEGYTKTFGLVHIAAGDQQRTPKASYHWLADHVTSLREDVARISP